MDNGKQEFLCPDIFLATIAFQLDARMVSAKLFSGDRRA